MKFIVTFALMITSLSLYASKSDLGQKSEDVNKVVVKDCGPCTEPSVNVDTIESEQEGKKPSSSSRTKTATKK